MTNTIRLYLKAIVSALLLCMRVGAGDLIFMQGRGPRRLRICSSPSACSMVITEVPTLNARWGLDQPFFVSWQTARLIANTWGTPVSNRKTIDLPWCSEGLVCGSSLLAQPCTPEQVNTIRSLLATEPVNGPSVSVEARTLLPLLRRCASHPLGRPKSQTIYFSPGQVGRAPALRLTSIKSDWAEQVWIDLDHGSTVAASVRLREDVLSSIIKFVEERSSGHIRITIGSEAILVEAEDGRLVARVEPVANTHVADPFGLPLQRLAAIPDCYLNHRVFGCWLQGYEDGPDQFSDGARLRFTGQHGATPTISWVGKPTPALPLEQGSWYLEGSFDVAMRDLEKTLIGFQGPLELRVTADGARRPWIEITGDSGTVRRITMLKAHDPDDRQPDSATGTRAG